MEVCYLLALIPQARDWLGAGYSRRRSLFPCGVGMVIPRTPRNKIRKQQGQQKRMPAGETTSAGAVRPLRRNARILFRRASSGILSPPDVRRGFRSRARCDHGSGVYRDVFCRVGDWSLLKTSRRGSARPVLSAFLFNLAFYAAIRFTECMLHGAIMSGRRRFC